jgi:SAM-dependent methyltransferase
MPEPGRDTIATPPSAASYNAWARYYDVLEGDREPYVTFYAGVARSRDRTICELGCGTGAVLVPLLERLREGGAELRGAGVDASEQMLARARQRDPGVDWRLGDMRAPPFEEQFDLVYCPINTLQVLLDDADLLATFSAARRLLAPGGRFAFDIYRPDHDWLRAPRSDVPGRRVEFEGRSLQLRESSVYDGTTRVLHLQWRLVDVEAPGTTIAAIDHEIRQYEAAEVESLLQAAGLRILERYGDLDRSPFHAGARKQVLVCSAA